MNKPALPQVWVMDDAEYEAFTSSQVHRGGSIVLVGGPLEYLTVSRWWVHPITWGPVLFVSLLWILRSCNWFGALLLFSVGWVAWMFVEYAIHRWAFHLEHWWPKGTWTGLRNVVHFSMHGVHHKYPGDSARTITPILMNASIALSVYVVLRTLVNRPWADPLMFGMVVGGLFYDYMHHAFHLPPEERWPLTSTWMRKMRKRHLNHHFSDDTRSYGVSSTFVDALFGTNSVF